MVCEKVGSTCCLCYLDGSRAYVANVGDSRAVGARLKPGGYHEAVPLSHDHNTANMKEVEAVRQRAGERDAVRCDPSEKREGTMRVDGVLMVTRALGDTALKPKFLTPAPEVLSMAISAGDFIVIASDGIWDILSSQEALRAAHKAREGNAARAIVRCALQRVAEDRSTTVAKLEALPPGEARSAILDDISCVVVFLGQAGGGRVGGRGGGAAPPAKRSKH